MLRGVLDAIHGIYVAPVWEWLAEPHAFSGGAEWLSVLRDRVAPLLPVSKRQVALDVIEQVAAIDDAPRALNHGDLAGSNLLWRDGRVSAVLDWDLAARCDPARRRVHGHVARLGPGGPLGRRRDRRPRGPDPSDLPPAGGGVLAAARTS
ncbi:MAG TPA: phosphotransferase [Candidatus Luteococcus avicola]|nr:phosphotransferase [Candidatus Luteococcus avicola]